MRSRTYLRRLSLLGLLSLAATAPAQAITIDELGLSEAQKAALVALINAPVVSPGIAFGSPVGFGMDYGQLGFAVGGATGAAQSSGPDVDGSASISAGLGDAQQYVGLETSLNLISLRGGFAEDGSLNTKLHITLPNQSGIAAGVENVGRWGDAKRGSSSAYVAYTQIFSLSPGSASPLPVSVNIGAGDGRFHDPADNGISVFGSLAVFPLPQMSLIADYTGRDLNLGLSYVPSRRLPVTVTLGAINLTEQENQDVEFSGAIGYSYRF